MRCPRCHFGMSAEAIECNNCGYQPTEVDRTQPPDTHSQGGEACNHCRRKIPAKSRYCPGCGRAVNGKSSAEVVRDERTRKEAEVMLTADYERRKFRLCPRQPSESVEAFAARINIEKTPAICSHLLRQGEPA
ncbi:MAG: zinc ribbon domain-containing protein [Gammaproteobacteria bacterium]